MAEIWQRLSVGGVISITESFPLDFILIIKHYLYTTQPPHSNSCWLSSPDARLLDHCTCHFVSRCMKIMACFELSCSQSRRFRLLGSSPSRWELILTRVFFLKWPIVDIQTPKHLYFRFVSASFWMIFPMWRVSTVSYIVHCDFF